MFLKRAIFSQAKNVHFLTKHVIIKKIFFSTDNSEVKIETAES